MAKFWRKTTDDVPLAHVEPNWSALDAGRLRLGFNMGMAHAGWSMEQHANAGDVMFLDEALMGLDYAQRALEELRRRSPT